MRSPAWKWPGKRLRRFGRDENGAGTIEFILWVPLIVSLVVLAANSALVMQTQTLLYDAARDASRSVATNNATATQAAERVLTRFGKDLGVSADVSVSGGFVTTTLKAQFGGIPMFGAALVSDLDLTAAVTMWVELDDEA